MQGRKNNVERVINGNCSRNMISYLSMIDKHLDCRNIVVYYDTLRKSERRR